MQDDLLAQQEAELAQLRDKLQQAHDSLFHAYEQIENLKYQASSECCGFLTVPALAHPANIVWPNSRLSGSQTTPANLCCRPLPAPLPV